MGHRTSPDTGGGAEENVSLLGIKPWLSSWQPTTFLVITFCNWPVCKKLYWPCNFSLDLLTPWSPGLLEKLHFTHFMEPKGSLPHLQEPATCPYPMPDQSHPCPHPTFWIYILILSSHLHLGFSVDSLYQIYQVLCSSSRLKSVDKQTSPPQWVYCTQCGQTLHEH